MAVTLGSIIPSLRISDKINKITNSLSRSMQRLSGDSKIENALDDAVNALISKKLDKNIKASDEVMENIQSANSLLNVAESSLDSISDQLSRINELLTSMANGANDIDAQSASAQEILERLSEIDRLASSANFNGKYLLNGTVEEMTIQIGTDTTQDSILDIQSALINAYTSALGLDIELPDELNPNAFETQGGDIVYKKENGKYCKKDGTEVIVADPAGLTPLFDPINPNCQKYLSKIQATIDKLSLSKGKIGSYENRLQSSYDSLSDLSVNLQDDYSNRANADIATESTNYIQQQILEQLNVSLLTQSNELGQLALTLLA